MRWIEWAFEFRTDLPTAEKLVLVYLAYRANHVGLGLMDRDDLQRLTGYEPRSIQRLLKSLRDAGVLVDSKPWYQLRDPAQPDAAPAEIGTLPLPPDGSAPAPVLRPLLEPADVEQAADRLGAAVQDGAGFLVDQLANFESRLAGILVRGQQSIDATMHSWAQTLAGMPTAPAAPPPDPVKESPLYVRLLDAGLAEDLAYATVKEQMERENHGEMRAMTEAADMLNPTPAGKVITETRPVLEQLGALVRPYTPKRDAYSDTPEGRFLRVWDLLHDQPPNAEAEADLMRLWLSLEAEENKHTVRGESVDAFEHLYPAIVRAAQQQKGKMPMRQFLDAAAIKQGRAPWDLDQAPAAAEDSVLEADINRMLRELSAMHDPRAAVGARTTEKGDDGVTRTETILGYHRRVKAKYEQMVKLRDMGALS
jgi:hypothetical protein